MKRFGATSFFVLICLTPSLAADFPARKPGLWQLNLTSVSVHTSFQECVDVQTDQATQSYFASIRPGTCSKHDRRKSGDTVTLDSTCTRAGRTLSIHMVATGSFDSNYTVTMTSQVQGLPASPSITATAKWLGPCAAGQQPGDIITPDGKTTNIRDLQKVMPGSHGAPTAPHQ